MLDDDGIVAAGETDASGGFDFALARYIGAKSRGGGKH